MAAEEGAATMRFGFEAIQYSCIGWVVVGTVRLGWTEFKCWCYGEGVKKRLCGCAISTNKGSATTFQHSEHQSINSLPFIFCQQIASPIFVDDDVKLVSFPKLQYLDLSMATISQQSMVELFAKCVNLKKLSLESVPLNAAVCAGIGKNRQLEALNLTMCSGLDKHGIKNLLLELKS